MSSSWKATTESGATYEFKRGILHIYSPRSGYTALFKPWKMKNVSVDIFSKWEKERRIDWEWINAMPFDICPRVGERFFAGGKDEWRLSTVIVSIEPLTEET